MVVRVKDILKGGRARTVKVYCPDCKHEFSFYTDISLPNEQVVDCVSCSARFIVAWDESDEIIVK